MPVTLRVLPTPYHRVLYHYHGRAMPRDGLRLFSPAYPQFSTAEGIRLATAGRLAESEAWFRRQLAQEPGNADAHNNLGLVLARLGRHDEALPHYRQALALDVSGVACRVNLALSLIALNRSPEAAAVFADVVRLQPDDPALWFDYGNLLIATWRHEDAAAAFSRVCELAPDYPYARGKRFYARQYCCDWRDYAGEREAIRRAVMREEPVITPFAFLIGAASPEEQLACVRRYARQYPARTVASPSGAPRTDSRIRVAYLSADYHEHATAYLMAELFERHDRNAFEVTALSYGPPSDGPMRRRLIRAFDHFLDVRTLSDEAVAALIREHGIDIAVDLKGYTTHARPGILAGRAAPVQVSYMGFAATTALPWLDYIVADPVVIPPVEDRWFTERVVRLPDSYLVNDGKREVAARRFSRAELGLPDDAFVYCCFNNTYKLTPAFFALWMRLLARTPGSVLWMMEGNAASRANLRDAARAAGIDPDRLVFAPAMPLADHLSRHREADLFLDTLPVNAHTTASDALWAGVPVLTCPGDTFVGRVAASLLRAVGLPELIVDDLEQYEREALALAQDRSRLRGLRDRLAAQRTTAPLFDADRFRRHLESAYRTMIARSRQGFPPRSFDVPVIPPG